MTRLFAAPFALPRNNTPVPAYYPTSARASPRAAHNST